MTTKDLAAPVPDTLPAADSIYHRPHLCLGVRGPAPTTKRGEGQAESSSVWKSNFRRPIDADVLMTLARSSPT